MKYCSHCGAQVNDEAEICVNCGCRISQKKSESSSTLATLAKVFMILGTIVMGFSTFLIGLAWCIPMTIAVCRRLDNNEPVGIALKVCSLLFVSLVGGILLLCISDD